MTNQEFFRPTPNTENIPENFESAKTPTEELPAIDAILQNPVLLDKVHQKIQELEIKSGGHRIEGSNESIDLDDRQKISFHKFIVLCSFYLGSNKFSGETLTLIKLIHDNPMDAKKIVEEKRAAWSSINNEGNNLSSIIPGAPALIVEDIYSLPDEEIPDLLARETAKVQDLLDMKPEQKDKIGRYLKNSTMIDLGAGSYANGFEVAKFFGANNYVAVEPFFADKLGNSMANKVKREGMGSLEKINLSYTDMLTFLKHMPSDLRNTTFLISGIDSYIFGTSGIDAELARNNETGKKKIEAGRKYLKDVQTELARVCGENCYIIRFESFGMPEETFTRVESERIKTSDGISPFLDVYEPVKNRP